MLVFLPGAREIRRTAGAAVPACRRRRRSWRRSTASCRRRRRTRRCAPAPAGPRKVVLATDDRRDQPDHRGRAGGGRQRPGPARRASTRGTGMTPAGDGARHAAPPPTSAAAAPAASRRAVLPAVGRGERGRAWRRSTRPRSWSPTWRRWRWSWRCGARARPGLPRPAAGRRAGRGARAAGRARARSTATAAITAAWPGAWPGCRCIRGSAHMVLRAKAEGVGGTAARAGGDPGGARPLAGDRPAPARSSSCAATAATRRVGPAARGGARRSPGASASAPAAERAIAGGAALALAYPDRVAKRRPGGRGSFLLADGRGAALRDRRPAGRRGRTWSSPRLDGAGARPASWLAAPMDEATLRGVLRRPRSLGRDRRLGRRRAGGGRPPPAPAGRAGAGRCGAAEPGSRRRRRGAAGGVRRLGLDALPWRAARWRCAGASASPARWTGADLADWSDAALTDDAGGVAGAASRPGCARRGRSRPARPGAAPVARARAGSGSARSTRLAPATIPIPERAARCDRLCRPGPPVLAVRAAGDVRPGRDAARRRRPGAGGDPPAVAGRPAAAGDPRPRRLLGRQLCRGAPGHARPLPAPPWPGRSAGGPGHRRAKPRGS